MSLADHYALHPMAPEFRALEQRVADLEAELASLQKAYGVYENDIQQILGKALDYPWYKDDQKNFPGATEADGVCVGEHVAVTLAAEMAAKYTAALARIAELERNSGTQPALVSACP